MYGIIVSPDNLAAVKEAISQSDIWYEKVGFLIQIRLFNIAGPQPR